MDPSLANHNHTVFNQSYVDQSGLMGYVFGLAAFILVLLGCIILVQYRTARLRSRHQLESFSSTLSSNLVLEEDLKARKKFVKHNLPFRSVTDEDVDGSISQDDAENVEEDDDDDGDCQQQPSALRRATVPRRHSDNPATKEGNFASRVDSCSTDVLESVDTGEVFSTGTNRNLLPVCSVCLGVFERGDQIAWSTNPSCSHQYHKECIVSWLMKHVDCPICRQVFLLEQPRLSLAGDAVSETVHHRRRALSEPFRPMTVAAAAVAQWAFRQRHVPAQDQQQQRSNEEHMNQEDWAEGQSTILADELQPRIDVREQTMPNIEDPQQENALRENEQDPCDCEQQCVMLQRQQSSREVTGDHRLDSTSDQIQIDIEQLQSLGDQA